MPEKICAFCGKTFQAKGRERYCPGPHYLPCPICGKPVEIKYPSDGARNCDTCKGKHSKNKQMVPVSSTPTESTLQSMILNAPKNIPEKVETVQDEPATKSNNVVEPSIDLTGRDIRTYIGNPHGTNYFIPGHNYILEIEPPSQHKGYYVYDVTGVWDVTEDKPVDIYVPFASSKSIEHNFKKATTG